MKANWAGHTLHGKHQKRDFRSRDQEATLDILRTADAVRAHLGATVEPHGITFQQYNVLRILRAEDPEPLATLEIAERLIERMPGITRLLDRLESRRWVRRERSGEDRRLVYCWITAGGRTLLEGLDAAMDRADRAPVRDLSPAELETLIGLLARVRRSTPSE
jgi:MarR family 2-MHQ and catechol resistance regulon transcriptional repressor